jgi:hypothetical protein
LGNEEKEDELLFKNYIDEKINFPVLSNSFVELIKKMENNTTSEEEVEERNDVCIYKTLLYPPKSAPPTID